MESYRFPWCPFLGLLLNLGWKVSTKRPSERKKWVSLSAVGRDFWMHFSLSYFLKLILQLTSFKISLNSISGLKLKLFFLRLIINMSNHCKLRHRGMILLNFRKFIPRERHIRIWGAHFFIWSSNFKLSLQTEIRLLIKIRFLRKSFQRIFVKIFI